MNKIERSIIKETQEQQGSMDLPLNEVFKQAREFHHISLKDASRATNISSYNLLKIEQGDWENLPADIYLRNFLIKYANFLKINKDLVIDLYENEVSQEKNKNQNEDIRKVPKKFFVVTPKFISKIVFSVFILIVAFYFVSQLGYLLGDPKLVVTSPESDIITTQKEVVLSGSTQTDNKVMINENEAFVDSNGSFSETLPLQPGINTIEIKAINRLNKETKIIRRIILEEE